MARYKFCIVLYCIVLPELLKVVSYELAIYSWDDLYVHHTSDEVENVCMIL